MRGTMARTRIAYRKRHQNSFSMFLVMLVVVMLLTVIAAKRVGLQQKVDAKRAELEELDAKYAAEEQRRLEIEEFRKETQTKGYIENQAREKLGLVYEDEILFKEGK